MSTPTWPKNPPPHEPKPDESPVAPLTRVEVEEAIRHLRATMKRAPKAMTERYHGQLDGLLEQWLTASLEESLTEEA